MNAVKVGDVVAWDEVPVGALISDDGDIYWRSCHRQWLLWDEGQHVTIIALGLTGQETAADLQRLAEVFEIWERINPLDAIWRMTLEDMATPDDAHWVVARRELANQLQNAGWLSAPLRTAESARRYLREVQS